MRLSEFDRTADRLEYPTTTDELTSRLGDPELSFQDGSAHLARLLRPFGPETYASADELRLAVHGALPVEAVGRRGYSDRDPPALGEFEPVSF